MQAARQTYLWKVELGPDQFAPVGEQVHSPVATEEADDGEASSACVEGVRVCVGGPTGGPVLHFEEERLLEAMEQNGVGRLGV